MDQCLGKRETAVQVNRANHCFECIRQNGRSLLATRADLTFTQAMRVQTNVTAEPAVGLPVTRRQAGFVFECFGEVARATSRDNETQDDFTAAAEVRRLGLL